MSVNTAINVMRDWLDDKPILKPAKEPTLEELSEEYHKQHENLRHIHVHYSKTNTVPSPAQRDHIDELEVRFFRITEAYVAKLESALEGSG